MQEFWIAANTFPQEFLTFLYQNETMRFFKILFCKLFTLISAIGTASHAAAHTTTAATYWSTIVIVAAKAAALTGTNTALATTCNKPILSIY